MFDCNIFIFLSFEFKNDMINKVAKTTFGIYLIHDSIFAREFIWHGILRIDTFWYNKVLFPIYAIVIIISAFLVCSIIDVFRIKLIEPKMIKFVDKKLQIFKEKYILKE